MKTASESASPDVVGIYAEVSQAHTSKRGKTGSAFLGSLHFFRCFEVSGILNIDKSAFYIKVRHININFRTIFKFVHTPSRASIIQVRK